MAAVVTDFPGLMPVNCVVVFPKTSDGALQAAPHAVTVTLASLAITELTNIVTHTGSKVLRSSCVALFTTAGGGTPTNDAELTALAERMAEDWYRWQLAKANMTLAGTVVWEPDGLVDALEWTHGERAHTRVFRPPFNDFGWDLGLAAGTGGSMANSIGDLFVTNLTVSGDVNFVDVTFNIDNSSTVNFNGTLVIGGPVIYPNPVEANAVFRVCPIQFQKTATGPTAISGDWTDLTGTSSTVSLGAIAKLNITGIFDFDGDASGTPGDQFEGRLVIDADNYADVATFGMAHASHRGTVAQVWETAELAAGSHTIKLQARRASGSGAVVLEVNTKWTATGMLVENRTVLLPTGTQIGPAECAAVDDCCAEDGSGGQVDNPSGLCLWCVGDQPTEWEATFSGFDATDADGDYTFTHVAGCNWLGVNEHGYQVRIAIVSRAWSDDLGISLDAINGDFSYSGFIPGPDPDCCDEIVLFKNYANEDAPADITLTPTEGCPEDAIETDCCPDDPTPVSLTASFADTGGCACIDGLSVVLTYDAGDDRWEGSNTNPCTAATIDVTVYCESGTWKITATGYGNANASSDTCDPFELVYNISAGIGGACSPSVGTTAVTVVPTP